MVFIVFIPAYEVRSSRQRVKHTDDTSEAPPSIYVGVQDCFLLFVRQVISFVVVVLTIFFPGPLEVCSAVTQFILTVFLFHPA